MPLDLDPLEQRLVGVLIEKETTVPETYPLTVNALVAGSNQKNNRDPHMDVQDYQVEGALKSLLMKGWALELERGGSRVKRYAHQADTQLGVTKAELALLAELLLRGPQAAPELGRRADRMCTQGTPEEVEQRLATLAARPVPYVRLLARGPGERLPRWTHLLAARATAASAASASVASSAPAHAAPAAVRPTPSPPPGPPATRPPSSAQGVMDDVTLEMERLRERVDTLERRLDRLEGR